MGQFLINKKTCLYFLDELSLQVYLSRLKIKTRPFVDQELTPYMYRVSNYRVGLLYALLCKGHACHILFSNIILKFRHETNCWSWFWVYKFDQKWKILKIQKKKKFFFQYFFEKFFSFLIGILHPKSWPTICPMS